MKRKLFLALFLIALLPYSIAEMFYLDVSRDLVASDDGNYDWMNINPFYSVYYGGDPSTGNVVKFIKGTDTMTFLPQALNYNNDLSQLEQISMPQSVSPVVSGSDIIYEDAYGTDIDLKYETQKDRVKEKLIIQQASALPTPAQYVQDGGGVVLELGFQLANDEKIYLDGVEWDRTSEVTTYNNIEVRNQQDTFLYNLTKPIAFDNDGESTTGYFVLKKSATKLYVRAYISYDWLNDTARVYPITLDPTFQVDYSPVPAQHLIDGIVHSEPDFDFDTLLDITAGVSDMSDATKYVTILNSVNSNSELQMMYKFEETSGSIVKDLFGTGLDINFSGTPDLNVGGADGSGIDFDGTDDFGIIYKQQNTSINEDFVVCISLNDGGLTSTQYVLDNKGGGTAEGVEVSVNPSDTVSFFVRRDNTQDTLTSITAIDDSSWHTVCGASFSNGTVQLYLDNVLEDSGTGVVGALDSTEWMHIGESHSGGNRYNQKLDELCAWRGQDLDETGIISFYETDYCGDSDGTAIVGRWTQTYEPNVNWFLRLKKVSTGTETIRVYPYNDSNNILFDDKIESILSGTGWFNINVTQLLFLENNTYGLNATILRFNTLNEQNFSEVLLRKEGNDTTAPTINQCWSNVTVLGCMDTAFLQCNVTDDVDVDYVNFTLNTNMYDTIKADDIFSLIFNPPDLNGTTIYDWNVTAKDISGNFNYTDTGIQLNHTCIFEDYINITHQGIINTDQFNLSNESVVIYWQTGNPSDSRVDYGNTSMTYTHFETDGTDVTDHYITLTGLTSELTYYYEIFSEFNPNQTLGEFDFTTTSDCVENWVEDSIVCLIDDSYLSTYTDINTCDTTINLPAQNGTYPFCNYCSENLVPSFGECQQNSTQTVDYLDANYITCCAVTGIGSDCSILIYPYNETTSQACLFFNNTLSSIECQNEPNFNVREKEYCLARIPNGYLNETFKCISYVTDYTTDEMMQTNPEYRERSTSFFDWKQDPETREYFAPAYALVNFYYTNKNLLPEQDYILTIECSSQQRILQSSMLFQMAYEDYQFVFFRTRWLMANASYIIGGLLLLILVVGGLLVIGKKVVF